MVQTLQATGTFFNQGWTLLGDTPAHRTIDEGAATHDGDSTLAVTGGASNFFGSFFPIPTTPVSTSGWKVRIVHRAQGSGTSFDYTMVFSEGTAVLGAVTVPAPPKSATVYTTVEVDIDEATAEAILAESTLILLPTLGPTQDGVSYIITAIELETPDVTIEERSTGFSVETIRSAEVPVELNYTRFSAEVMRSRGLEMNYTRFSAEVMRSPPRNSATSTQSTSFVVETIRSSVVESDLETVVTRFTGEVMHKQPLEQRFLVSRFTGEVMRDRPPGEDEGRLTRLTLETLRRVGDLGVYFTRFSGEVMSPRISTSIKPLEVNLGDYPYLPANWRTPIGVQTAYQTDVKKSSDVSEERTRLLVKPQRTVTAELSALRDITKLKTLAFQKASVRHPSPIYSDFTRTTAATTDSSTIPCNTQWRRFFIGQRVMIVDQDLIYYSSIAAVESSNLLVEDVLSLRNRSVVFPLFDAEIEMDTSFENITDDIGTADFSATEILGPSGLPGTELGIKDTHEGTPIFDVPESWDIDILTSVSTTGQVYSRGKGSVVKPTGERPIFIHSTNFQFHRREDFWQLLNWFDYMAGRWRVVWFIPKSILFKITATGRGYFDFQPFSTITNETLSKFIQNVFVDGTIYEVDSIENNRVSLAGSTGTVTGSVARPAHLIRCSDDFMEETWITDEHCQVSMSFTERILENHVPLGLS